MNSPAFENPDRSFAIVTPSFLPDLPRCELLVEFLERVSPQVPHYLIVDRRDLAAFRHLERGKRRLLEVRSACRQMDVANAGPARSLAESPGASGARLDPPADPEDRGRCRNSRADTNFLCIPTSRFSGNSIVRICWSKVRSDFSTSTMSMRRSSFDRHRVPSARSPRSER